MSGDTLDFHIFEEEVVATGFWEVEGRDAGQSTTQCNSVPRTASTADPRWAPSVRRAEIEKPWPHATLAGFRFFSLGSSAPLAKYFFILLRLLTRSCLPFCAFFYFYFLDVDHFFKVLIEFVKILLLFCVFGFSAERHV